MNLALIPCAPTAWRRAGRLLGRVEVPPTEDAPDRCRRWAEQLRPLGLTRLIHADDDLSAHTAGWISETLGIATRTNHSYREVELGLWTGLTDAQLKSRFASAHKQLQESPLKVSPPAGEDLADAVQRLDNSLRKTLRKAPRIGIVLRPIMRAAAGRLLTAESFHDLWTAAQLDDEPTILHVDRVPAGARSV